MAFAVHLLGPGTIDGMLPPNPDIVALMHGDRIAVSADLLSAVYGRRLDDSVPRAELGIICQTLARRHGLPWRPSSFKTSFPKKPDEGAIARICIDLIGGWSRAGLAFVASSHIHEGTTEIVLTFAGEQAINKGTVAAALLEYDGIRSFLPY